MEDVQSIRLLWLERRIHFANVQGLTNKDGSLKTECGIHVAGEDEGTGLSNIRG